MKVSNVNLSDNSVSVYYSNDTVFYSVSAEWFDVEDSYNLSFDGIHAKWLVIFSSRNISVRDTVLTGEETLESILSLVNSSGIRIYNLSYTGVWGKNVDFEGVNDSQISLYNFTAAERIELHDSSGNTFYLNLMPGKPLVDPGNAGNNWDNGMYGNYWPDYNGTDADGDGVGDTPYIINEVNIDHYPLVQANLSFYLAGQNNESGTHTNETPRANQNTGGGEGQGNNTNTTGGTGNQPPVSGGGVEQNATPKGNRTSGGSAGNSWKVATVILVLVVVAALLVITKKR